MIRDTTKNGISEAGASALAKMPFFLIYFREKSRQKRTAFPRLAKKPPKTGHDRSDSERIARRI